MYLCLVRLWHLAFHYLNYLFRARTEHAVHSPFVFELVTQVIYNKNSFYAYNEVEQLRNKLLSDNKQLNVLDLGAQKGNYLKTIKSVAYHSLKRPKYGQLIFRLVNHFHPETILELGTSLGITTAYIAKSNPKAKIITMEGAPEIAQIAQQNFETLGIGNIQTVLGNFDSTLEPLLQQISQLDFVFFDGNHRKIPTLKYFESCLRLAHNQSVFIFDDIYWSPEMTEAWKVIKAHPKTTVTIDLFEMGIVFFRKEQAKQHFVIRY